MGDLPEPAFVRDNPVMAAAFAGFMGFIWGEPGAHAQFCADTGHAAWVPPKNGLEAAIDRATGHADDYALAFAAWAIRTQWGEAGGEPGEDECRSGTEPQVSPEAAGPPPPPATPAPQSPEGLPAMIARDEP